MKELRAGDLLPEILTDPPGPRSRELADELRAHESPNVTFVSDSSPIFWREALGANVLDVDGNLYIDLTAGFGVAAAGHRNPRVTAGIRRQLDALAHGLGDVHPPDIKVEFLQRLTQITPAGLERTILASSGAEAVEAALKTARLASGRPGVLYFSGAYHGLTYGALAVTDGSTFREPFQDQLGVPAVRADYPHPYHPPAELAGSEDLAAAALEAVTRRLEGAGNVIGAVIVEPIQGRGGVVVPPRGFLRGLRQECDRRGLLLIFDEIYTGCGRTGRWFACQHEHVTPDLLCVGKALSGSLPFSACIGTPEAMSAWPESTGAAIHTSTFLGHPLGCAAALAQIEEIGAGGLIPRAERLGEVLLSGLRALHCDHPRIGDVRGRGLMAALELVREPGTRLPDAHAAAQLAREALRRGVILLAEDGVLTLSPPLNITRAQLNFALRALEDCLHRL